MKKKNSKNLVKVKTDANQAILNAYLEISYNEGVAQMTLQKLSTATGLSPSNVKYHIDNNNETLEEQAKVFIRNHINLYLETEIFKDKQSNGFNPLHSYVQHMLGWAYKYKVYSSYLIYIYHLTSTQEKNDYSSILLKALSRIETFLNEGVGMGIYPLNIKNKGEIVRSVHALILGQLIVLTNLKSKTDFQSRVQETCKMINLILQK